MKAICCEEDKPEHLIRSIDSGHSFLIKQKKCERRLRALSPSHLRLRLEFHSWVKLLMLVLRLLILSLFRLLLLDQVNIVIISHISQRKTYEQTNCCHVNRDSKRVMVVACRTFSTLKFVME